jgi:nucleotide-binding universal stress UspA family protein
MGELVSLEPPHIRQTLLGDLQALQSPPSVPTEYRLEEGAVADAILRVASEIDCDLIVIGTHGRKGVGRFVLGSIAEKVLRNAPCLVLTVKGGAAKIPG